MNAPLPPPAATGGSGPATAAPAGPVHLERRGRVAVLWIDSPPVNALSTAVRDGLLAALAEAAADPAIDGLVVAGRGRVFVAGADLNEMNRPPEEPHLPAVVAALEAFPKPTAAALHGAALGGGLELALAARIRVAGPKTSLGFPETNVGLVPGATGTQRLLRLADFATAARLVASGRPVDAARGLALGLVTALADGPAGEPPVAAAVAALEGVLAGAPLPASTADGPAATTAGVDLAALAAEVAKAAKGRAAPGKALDLLVETATLPFAESCARERALFLALRGGPENRALVHLFKAEREAGRLPELKDVAPRPLARVGVVGGGLMGAGIAFAALAAGLPVTLLEADAARVAAACGRLAGLLDGAVAGGRLTTEARAAREAALTLTADPGGLGDADLVVEAVFEDPEVKRGVLATLDAATRPDCVIASNTSYLDLDDLAAGTKDASRVVGLHFFSPAHVMKLVEVVRGRASAPDVVATAVAVARRLGKIPVVTGVCEGFCANRILKRWRAAAEAMVEDGADPAAVDAAMTGYGLAMGPFAVQDLAGLEIALANRRRSPATRPDGRRLDLIERLVAAGRLGAKAGRGWYDYAPGERRGTPSAEVAAIVAAAAAEHGVARRDFGADELLARQLAAIRSEARAILAEGIVATPAEIDLVMVHGFGFPAHRGGPLFEALVGADTDGGETP